MKLWSRKRAAAEEEPGFEQEPEDLNWVEPADLHPGRERWSTAFLVVGSALVGATALALYNRRTIANMRAQIQAQPERSTSSPPMGEEI